MPSRLPESADFHWQTELSSESLGGISADQAYVFASGRDVLDQKDVFYCLNVDSGIVEWQISYDAPGNLDYGMTPRATPTIDGELVFFQGAMGHLSCVDRETGTLFWRKNLLEVFKGDEPTWGVCGSPLIVGDKVVVQPGGPEASIVAFDRESGELVWSVPGGPSGYSSMIIARIDGTEQIIGYDKTSLFGLAPEDGEILWKHQPQHENDFNVPTPIALQNHLVVSTENNGTRVMSFKSGELSKEPISRHELLAPDTHTPIVTNGRVFGVLNRLYCLSWPTLKEVWTGDEPGYGEYCSIIGSGQRVLVLTTRGQLILVDANADHYRVLGKLQLAEDVEVNSHPAIVGRMFFVRLGKKICRLDFQPAGNE